MDLATVVNENICIVHYTTINYSKSKKSTCFMKINNIIVLIIIIIHNQK